MQGMNEYVYLIDNFACGNICVEGIIINNTAL